MSQIHITKDSISDAARKSIEQQRTEFIPPLTDREIANIMRKFEKALADSKEPGSAWAKCVEHLWQRKHAWKQEQERFKVVEKDVQAMSDINRSVN